MRNLILIAVAMLTGINVFAQDVVVDGSGIVRKDNERKGPAPKVYFNLSTGINSNGGIIGLGFDIPITPEFSLEPGGGVGMWGYKLYGCGKYYFKPNHRGWAIGAGATYSAGLSNVTTSLQTYYSDREDVELNLLPQVNVFAAAYKFWTIGRRSNRFYLQFGWSAALSTKKFEQTGGNPITVRSADAVRFLSPGGIIVAGGFSFGGYRQQPRAVK